MAELLEAAPDLISEASKSPLGLLALVILSVAALAFVFFRHSGDTIRVTIFMMLLLGAGLFSYQLLRVQATAKFPQGSAVPSGIRGLTCPPPPQQLSVEQAADVELKVGALRKFLGSGELNVETSQTARNLYAEYPDGEKLAVAQLLISLFCQMLERSDLPDHEKLEIYLRTQTEILGVFRGARESRSTLQVIDLRAEENLIDLKAKNSGEDSAFLTRFIFALFPAIIMCSHAAPTVYEHEVLIGPDGRSIVKKTSRESLFLSQAIRREGVKPEFLEHCETGFWFLDTAELQDEVPLSQIVPPKGGDRIQVRFAFRKGAGCAADRFLVCSALIYDDSEVLPIAPFQLSVTYEDLD